MGIQVIRADENHLEFLLPLFNGYREFYEQPRDEAGARAYLEARMRDDDAVIFLAVESDNPGHYIGFVLLYPTFDSVVMAPVWVLHDLFVDPECRQRGIGRVLMNVARDYCRRTDGVRVDLSTAITNENAQALYESLGYERDTEFFQYSLALSPDES